jgi:hypothetical protein
LGSIGLYLYKLCFTFVAKSGHELSDTDIFVRYSLADTVKPNTIIGEGNA